MKTNLFQPIEIKTIPVNGISFDLTATKAECDTLAERFELPAVHSFKLHGELSGADIICFNGRFKADITRECVVSLEPFDTTVSGGFKEFFSESGTDFSKEVNFDIDMDGDDVDLIKNGRLNIGEIAAEHFGLNLDAFPHKPGVTFQYENTVPEKQNPFAVLKNLIKK